MRFQVPQFIEIQDKIFGELTLRQFLYLAGGGGMCFILIKILPTILGIILSLPVAGLSLALSFYKYNDRQFIFVMQSAIMYALGTKLYLWKKEPKKIEGSKQSDAIDSMLYIPKMADSKLKDITWSLDVSKEALNPVTRDQK